LEEKIEEWKEVKKWGEAPKKGQTPKNKTQTKKRAVGGGKIKSHFCWRGR